MKKLILSLFSLILISRSVFASGNQDLGVQLLSTTGGVAVLVGIAGGAEAGMGSSIAVLLAIVSSSTLGKKYVEQLNDDVNLYYSTGEISVSLEKFVETVQMKNPELSSEEIINQI